MSKLLENKNALPFEAQNHCKLSLEDIDRIQYRYNNGDSIKEIHLDYPFVSQAAIRYWAYKRDEDLERRKNSDSYFSERDKRDKDYLVSLVNRRLNNGLSVSRYIPKTDAKHKLTGVKLDNKTKEMIVKDYETLTHTTQTLSQKYNVPKTIVQSTLQSKHYNKRFKEAKHKKANFLHLGYIDVYDMSKTKSNEEISLLTGYSVRYIETILAVCRNPEKYLDNRYNGTMQSVIANTMISKENYK